MATVDVSGTTLSRLGSATTPKRMCSPTRTLRLGDARRHIDEYDTANCLHANPDYGRGIARAFCLDRKPAVNDRPRQPDRNFRKKRNTNVQYRQCPARADARAVGRSAQSPPRWRHRAARAGQAGAWERPWFHPPAIQELFDKVADMVEGYSDKIAEWTGARAARRTATPGRLHQCLNALRRFSTTPLPYRLGEGRAPALP
jgi:hypothetical protein